MTPRQTGWLAVRAEPGRERSLCRRRPQASSGYREQGDDATARLYEEIIQPDEVQRHHELGRRLLLSFGDDRSDAGSSL